MCKIVDQKATQLYTGLKKIKDPNEIFTFQTFHLALLTPEILFSPELCTSKGNNEFHQKTKAIMTKEF